MNYDNQSGGASGAVLQPSLRNALPHFTLLLVFPLMVGAARYGGWWILAPFLFFSLTNSFDTTFGVEERNMDVKTTPENRLLPYRLPLWLWAGLYPVIIVFGLWQILVVGHLSFWEIALVALLLSTVAQSVFIVAHELVHSRSVWERRLGEFLLASVSYPHYATEHVYLHHPLACTPADLGSPRKGQSFWRYFPREVVNNLFGAWRFERARLARRHLPVWHHTNPFWRYLLLTGAWYGLVYWLGGPWAVLVYALLCLNPIFAMKVVNYIHHYGLQRVRLPSGRFERVQWRHAWTSAGRFTNWLYFNVQRHADHHIVSSRPYPLLQHQGADTSPQLPGTYAQMSGLALFPKRWFETMDPLVDQWRKKFYPQLDNWEVYDSPAFAARPDAFEAIAEILAAAPRLAEWINQAPELLDHLQEKEFTDLDLPDGFGPDPEFELIARRGLTRLYWTLELDADEMKERLSEVPMLDVADAVEISRNWSNGKVFQVNAHTLRGNLSPLEAGTALANIAEAAIATALAHVMEDFAERRGPAPGAVAAILVGGLTCEETVPGTAPDVLFVYHDGPDRYYQDLCRRGLDALRKLSQNNLLLAPLPRDYQARPVCSLADFTERYRATDNPGELLELVQTRCVFTSGDSALAARFEQARHAILSQGAARAALLEALRDTKWLTAKLSALPIENRPGGLRDVERAARLLQITHAAEAPDLLSPGIVSAFKGAAERDLLDAEVAERLTTAATLWRNLRGVLRLVGKEGFAFEHASAATKAVAARACGEDDFDALISKIVKTTDAAAAAVKHTGAA